jgi:plasmid stability protein
MSRQSRRGRPPNFLRSLEPVEIHYPETVKNVTVSVPDDVYRRARLWAAKHGTTVSAMIAEYLRSIAGHRRNSSAYANCSGSSQRKLGTSVRRIASAEMRSTNGAVV